MEQFLLIKDLPCFSFYNLQLYFDKITELTLSRPESVLFEKALTSLATDSGLHPLVPYFSYFIADEVGFVQLFIYKSKFPSTAFTCSLNSQVPRSLNDLPILFALMRVVRSLLCNPHIHIEPYVSCLLLIMLFTLLSL